MVTRRKEKMGETYPSPPSRGLKFEAEADPAATALGRAANIGIGLDEARHPAGGQEVGADRRLAIVAKLGAGDILAGAAAGEQHPALAGEGVDIARLGIEHRLAAAGHRHAAAEARPEAAGEPAVMPEVEALAESVERAEIGLLPSQARHRLGEQRVAAQPGADFALNPIAIAAELVRPLLDAVEGGGAVMDVLAEQVGEQPTGADTRIAPGIDRVEAHPVGTGAEVHMARQIAAGDTEQQAIAILRTLAAQIDTGLGAKIILAIAEIIVLRRAAGDRDGAILVAAVDLAIGLPPHPAGGLVEIAQLGHVAAPRRARLLTDRLRRLVDLGKAIDRCAGLRCELEAVGRRVVREAVGDEADRLVGDSEGVGRHAAARLAG